MVLGGLSIGDSLIYILIGRPAAAYFCFIPFYPRFQVEEPESEDGLTFCWLLEDLTPVPGHICKLLYFFAFLVS